MRVIDHTRFVVRKKRRERRRKFTYLFMAILLLSSGLGFNYYRPLPKLEPVKAQEMQILETPVGINWPKQGQAAVAAKGYNILAETPNQKAVPAASTVKVFTALMVLRKHPLKLNQTGPVLIVDQNDVDSYNRYVSVGGSVVAVNFGERITEHQALQALLVPSGNNIADMLAIWAYGSLENYIAESNKYAVELGLKNTHIADASGLSPQTVSTPHDLVLLGQKIFDDPVLTRIIDQEQATLPVAGIVSNTNSLVSRPDIIGIKTGHTDEAGGCYVFAARREIAPGKPVIVIGAVMGMPNIIAAIDASLPLLDQTYAGFKEVKLVSEGQKIGTYQLPWGRTVSAVAQQDLMTVVWKANVPNLTNSLRALSTPAGQNQEVGSVLVKADYLETSIPVVLAEAISQPPLLWRLFRLF